MSSILDIVIISFGAMLGLVIVGLILLWFIQDVTQKKHSVLRNYPVIGRLRFILENQGKYLRQYFFASDRDEMPFNRATRAWVYKNAKNTGSTVGFGSTYDLREPGSIIFVNAAFPILEENQLPTPCVQIGENYCEHPFEAKSIINISGMSFGALSAPAVRALSLGAAKSRCWLNTGEGGLAPYHQEGDCDIIVQIGTAKYGIRDDHGDFSPARAKKLGKVAKAFEIKLSQEEMRKGFGKTYGQTTLVLDMAIAAHSREENRYLITFQSPYSDMSWGVRTLQYDLLPWELKSKPVARTEQNVPAYVVKTEQLEQGFPVSITLPMLNEPNNIVQVNTRWEPVPANSLSS